jgi:mono/diheme cytochrome c family protein
MRNLEIPRARPYIGKLIFVGLFLCIGNLAFAQDKQPDQEQIEKKSPLAGARMFKAYCTSCHGKDAKGHGPVAAALKQEPADLTTLAKRHGGRFPDAYVQGVLRNGVNSPAHGDAEMPVWGPLFKQMDPDGMFMHVRISSVMIYLKSLQVK